VCTVSRKVYFSCLIPYANISKTSVRGLILDFVWCWWFEMLLTTAGLTSLTTLRSLSSCCKGQKVQLAWYYRCDRDSSSSVSSEFRLWDSFEKKVTPLISSRPDILTWYACGPTVYDSAHIGHARFVKFSVSHDVSHVIIRS